MLTTEKMNSAASVNVPLLPPADIVLENERIGIYIAGGCDNSSQGGYCEDCQRKSLDREKRVQKKRRAELKLYCKYVPSEVERCTEVKRESIALPSCCGLSRASCCTLLSQQGEY